MQDIQTNKQSNEEIREKAARKIYDIKQKAKQDIEEVKYNMHLELLVGNPRAIDRACKKENRRRYREAKREEYRNRTKRYSLGEEIFNSITHGIGAGLAIAALVLLIVKAALYAPHSLKAYYVTSWTLFYAVSRAYPCTGKKRFFRIRPCIDLRAHSRNVYAFLSCVAKRSARLDIVRHYLGACNNGRYAVFRVCQQIACRIGHHVYSYGLACRVCL